MIGKGWRVEFCGGIGAGKSTVARLLAAHCRLALVEEHYEQVPFWKEFYREPEGYAFEKNVSFLLFHSNAIRAAAAQVPPRPLVCDFALFQDLAYAAMSGVADDYDATLAVHERLVARLEPPALIVYVRCSLDEQLARIRQRGREPERAITRAYLEDLSGRIAVELGRQLPMVPVIEVDTDRLDFVVDPSAGLSALAPRFEKWLAGLSPAAPDA